MSFSFILNLSKFYLSLKIQHNVTSTMKPPLILLVMIISSHLTHILLLIPVKHLFSQPCVLGDLWKDFFGSK